jgi:hypothetical protein
MLLRCVRPVADLSTKAGRIPSIRPPQRGVKLETSVCHSKAISEVYVNVPAGLGIPFDKKVVPIEKIVYAGLNFCLAVGGVGVIHQSHLHHHHYPAGELEMSCRDVNQSMIEPPCWAIAS